MVLKLRRNWNLLIGSNSFNFRNKTWRRFIITLLKSTFWHNPTLSSWRCLSHRNHSTDLLCKSIAWFLYDSNLCHERVKSRDLPYYSVPLLAKFHFSEALLGCLLVTIDLVSCLKQQKPILETKQNLFLLVLSARQQ